MADQHVIAGLVRKRAELSGEIEAIRQMSADLENLDVTLRMFDPAYEIESMRPKAFRPPEDWAKRDEMTPIGILRQAAGPLTTRDIALQLIVERALDKNDQRLLRLTTKRVGVALWAQRTNGTVRCEQGPGQFNVWEINR